MSKETVVDVNLKFIVTETGMFPPYEGVCKIKCTGADGKDWSGSIKYDDARSVDDCIKTICRMDSFKAILPKLAVVASDPTPEETTPDEEKASETPVADHYAKIRAELIGKKIGELRKIISDQNLDLTTGGKKKELVVKQIIDCLKKRDGITENSDEKA